ncbi:ufm1-specific protease 2 [Schistocerca nitens]|uniref:ufm1-specific protease 2 n=1 Tax=Schistocerca nitens TaxID=7011 RepID=UPI002118083E|nr:ufm1-specific protease 2 [Schistocerca nitens]
MNKGISPEIRITKNFLERAVALDVPNVGCLYGIKEHDYVLVLGFSIEQKLNPNKNLQEGDFHEKASFSERNLPAGLTLCGVLRSVNTSEEQNQKHKSENTSQLDHHVLIVCVRDETNELKAYMNINNKYVSKTYQVVDDCEVWKEYLHIRVKGRLPITCEMSAESVVEAIGSLQKKVSSDMLAFSHSKARFYLSGDQVITGTTELTSSSTVGDLQHIYSANSETITAKGAKHSNIKKWPETVTLEMLKRPMAEVKPETQVRTAPIIQYVKKHYECLKIWIHIDGLSMVNRKSSLQDLYKCLQKSVKASLQLSEESLIKQLSHDSGDSSRFSLPLPFHFMPKNFSHFVTLVYPKNSKDDDLSQIRSVLHQQFHLPDDKPFFRRANAFVFRDDLPKPFPLINPHEGLNPSGVKGGEVAVVRGLYSYHHYMQDRMDDDGWGCAYRSLQTVVSWFRWQGYTDKPVPTHKEIQECLVSIGDKPSSFIGSKQWIGSTEVSFYLETVLGVTSRILSVSSGEELAYQGGELLEHFRTHGTPVMIGGGVLAHTIIGVHYCNETGNLKFLILDPHYTGVDDLSIVQSKGWCGWKSVEFWSKGAFYNLCLPLCPVLI